MFFYHTRSNSSTKSGPGGYLHKSFPGFYKNYDKPGQTDHLDGPRNRLVKLHIILPSLTRKFGASTCSNGPLKGHKRILSSTGISCIRCNIVPAKKVYIALRSLGKAKMSIRKRAVRTTAEWHTERLERSVVSPTVLSIRSGKRAPSRNTG